MQRYGPNLEGRLVQKETARRWSFVELLSGLPAGLQTIDDETFVMEFADLEPRSPVADTVPVDAADQPGDMIRQSRWPEQAAGSKITDTGAHKPQKSADVIDVGVADKYFGDLMRKARRQPTTFTEIEQDGPFPVMQSQVKKRVTENTVHQNGGSVSDPSHRAGTGVFPYAGIWRDIRRRDVMQGQWADRLHRSQVALPVSIGIAGQYLIRYFLGVGNTDLKNIFRSLENLAHGNGSSSFEQGDLPAAPMLLRLQRRRGSGQLPTGECKGLLNGMVQIFIPQTGAPARPFSMAGRPGFCTGLHKNDLAGKRRQFIRQRKLFVIAAENQDSVDDCRFDKSH